MRTLTSITLILFLSLLSSPSWTETLTMDDLVERNDLYYKKFTNVPFTGEISGIWNGNYKDGKEEGLNIYQKKRLLHSKCGQNSYLNEFHTEHAFCWVKNKGFKIRKISAKSCVELFFLTSYKLHTQHVSKLYL